MDQQALTNLAVLLALGAGFVAPTKAVVDLVKTSSPNLPAWAVLLAALLSGEVLVTLVAVYGGLDPTPAHLAGVVLGGAVAAVGAVASTELHAAARSNRVTVEDVADELETRMKETPTSVSDSGHVHDTLLPPDPLLPTPRYGDHPPTPRYGTQPPPTINRPMNTGI